MPVRDQAIPNYGLLTPPISWLSCSSWPSCFRQPSEGQALALRLSFFLVGAVCNRAYGQPHSVGRECRLLPVRAQASPNYGLWAWRGTGPRPTVKGGVFFVVRGPVPRNRGVARRTRSDARGIETGRSLLREARLETAPNGLLQGLGVARDRPSPYGDLLPKRTRYPH